jgi:DNA polymerase
MAGTDIKSPRTITPAVQPGAAPSFEALMRDVRACYACVRMTHSHVLHGSNGPLDADAIFVAEAPGRRGAAVTGVPLTGDESGRRFGEFLRIASIGRERVFVTNALLCNPLDDRGANRRPGSAEIDRCRPFLERTLACVQAPIVVALGRVALEALRRISPHAAQLDHDVATPLPWRGRTLVAMYHPSRQSTLHRSQRQQEEDWRTLGVLCRRLGGLLV